MSEGKRIRYYRNKNRITMKQLAERIGVSEQAIGNYERGDRTPSTQILIKIANALGVDTIDLLDIKKDGTPRSTPGVYVTQCPKDNALEELLNSEEKPVFTENEIIMNIINDYNRDIFNKKYNAENITEKEIENLKPIIRGIIEIALNKYIKNNN